MAKFSCSTGDKDQFKSKQDKAIFEQTKCGQTDGIRQFKLTGIQCQQLS
jgi:hypothetical protein